VDDRAEALELWTAELLTDATRTHPKARVKALSGVRDALISEFPP
jgi:hypothetical protein